MGRKARVRLGVVVGIAGAIALVITGIDALHSMPYFPQVGVIVIICGLVVPFLIPMGIKNINRKADEAKMLAEWRKQRDKQQPRL
jgi:hypothetical protein